MEVKKEDKKLIVSLADNEEIIIKDQNKEIVNISKENKKIHIVQNDIIEKEVK